jgi:hypothetical protein
MIYIPDQASIKLKGWESSPIGFCERAKLK